MLTLYMPHDLSMTYFFQQANSVNLYILNSHKRTGEEYGKVYSEQANAKSEGLR